MKHAYLIIAHSEYPILQILLSMLDEYGNDVYLHIDKRAKVLHRELKSFKMDKAGFFILENPIKVYWGNISQIKAEYLLFETALANGPYAYPEQIYPYRNKSISIIFAPGIQAKSL